MNHVEIIKVFEFYLLLINLRKENYFIIYKKTSFSRSIYLAMMLRD